jgi:GNAT superfamily N-acetyltransferase
VRVVEYEPSRRADVADLMARVWGERPAETELEWFYERNPVRPASVLLAEDAGKAVATVALSFQRMSIGGDELEVGTAVRLATDPAHRGQGIFSRLMAANEERARDVGVRLLLTVPNLASTPVLLGRLGWRRLRDLRIWARLKPLPSRPRIPPVGRFVGLGAGGGDRAIHGDRVLRDERRLNWRFAEAPRDYVLLDGDGYAAVGRRGRLAVVAAVEGELLDDAAAAARAPALIAAPPPWQRRRYLLAGYVPTPRTFTVLGKSLADGQALPAQPHLELGDLDFL